MTASNNFVWRSLLYVPANIEKYVAAAHTRGADCIQLDLEDSVPAGEKAAARDRLADAAARGSRGGADVVVRINRPLGLAVRDIEAAVGPHVQAIAISKTESADHVRLLDELVSETESARGLEQGRIRLIALIETASAYFQMQAIATATPRLVAMIFGAEDFALDLGIEPEEEALLAAKQQMIIAARSGDLMPLGLVGRIASYNDDAAFADMVKRSRRCGFVGASCIHPRQVTVLNRAFAPTELEIASANRIVQEDEHARASGHGAFSIDGTMVDAPIVMRAKKLLERHATIVAREQRFANYRGAA